MNKLHIILPAFILVAMVQLFVPAKMIYDKEDVLKTGKEFKFKTEPIDPNDPFRGKYIVLNYEENELIVNDKGYWERRNKIYLIFENDEKGFAKIKKYSAEKPVNEQYFLQAEIYYVSEGYNGSQSKLTIKYPFERFYMEESKAKPAEKIYRQSIRDSTQIAYSLVNIKNGDAVIKDVIINGKSVIDLVKEQQ